MSYKLITKALFTVTNAAGVKTEREVQVRAYPAPKRDASGSITIDGADGSYKRTGGKGRGTVDNRYMYAVIKGQPAFWPITEAEATALAGGVATLASIAAPVAPAPAAAAPVAPEAPAAPVADAPKAARRGRNTQAA